MPFSQVLNTESGRLARGTILVAISSSVREDWVRTALLLDRAGLRVVTVLVDAAGFGGISGADRLREQLLATGTPAILLRNGEPLQEALNSLPPPRAVPLPSLL
jgi:hypothetical protein